MFTLTNQAIDSAALKRAMSDSDHGALVEFTGVVRKQNGGRAVIALEYEGAAALAAAEFARIADEARASFAILDARCAHRVGRLAPGETAVWVGVTAAHREAAFAACQFIVNQLKQRVPVWKKEYYADGDSGWVNQP
jgi:molybdopterin synthase catalytic subunit